jgi:hypothetical protein
VRWKDLPALRQAFAEAFADYKDYIYNRLFLATRTRACVSELALGDLVSGEERYVVLMLEVLPLPLLPGRQFASRRSVQRIQMTMETQTSPRLPSSDLGN